jgi:SAM-dependent methyltransferase
MMDKSAYVFHELEKSIDEGRRLGDQALAFVELELPGFLAKIPPNSTVADFGCGTGVISAAMALHLPQGRVIGLDPDTRALELARETGQGIQNLSFENYGFGSTSEAPGGPFDASFTRLVLLHMPDPAAAIAQMARCLKPGGLLYLVDCDDDYNNFFPVEAWQGELAALMKKSQALRGGTRTLGSRLLSVCQQGGFWPEGAQVIYYSTAVLGLERWKRIFLPAEGGMAARDLRYLAERGLIDPSALGGIAEKLGAFFGRGDVKAQISTWHVWARKP